MFLKVGDSSGEWPELVLAADRIAWHPDRVDADLGIAEDHVLLGDLGMDVGLFDQVRDRKGLVAADRECFYQLLTAVGRADAAELARHGRNRKQFNIAQLLTTPKTERGKPSNPRNCKPSRPINWASWAGVNRCSWTWKNRSRQLLAE